MPRWKRRQQPSLKLAADIRGPATPLPTELLWDIFHHVKSDRPSLNNYPPLFESPFAPEIRWVPEVTHVCRHWRALALADSTLWTDICVSASNHWATVFLTRSKESQVRLSADVGIGAAFSGSSDARRRQNLKLCRTVIKKHHTRLESIEFTQVDSDGVDGLLLLDKSSKVAHGVKELIMTGLPDEINEPCVLQRSKAGAQFAFNLFTPTRLHLTNCTLDWALLKQFQSLTILHLQLNHSNPEVEIPGLLREALHNVPRLRKLVVVAYSVRIDDNFDVYVEDEIDEPPSSAEAAFLPDLREIRIRYPSPKWIQHVLRGIVPLGSIPHPNLTERRWDIIANDLLAELPSHPELFLDLLEHVSASEILVVRLDFLRDATEPESIKITQGAIFSVWTATSAMVIPNHMPTSQSSPFSPPVLKYQASLSTYYDWRERYPRVAPETIFHLLCSSGSYDHLEQLELLHPHTFPEPHKIAETIGRLPQLRTVRIEMHNSGEWGLCSFFAALTYDTDASNVHNIPFSTLRFVYIRGSNGFKAQVDRDLLSAMTERRALDFRILELGLPPEDPKAGYVRDIEALREAVSSVIVLE